MKCDWCNRKIGLHKWRLNKDTLCERCATIYIQNMIKLLLK